jgi:hypothetical protein
MRLRKLILLGVTGLVLACYAAVSAKVVSFPLGQGGQCRWELNKWYNARCVLSYYENGIRKGILRTDKGLFTWPVAVFPGPANNTIICLYELDTTVAIFTVDLGQVSPKGIPPPERLADTILFSNFRARACTHAEVNYLRNYLSSTRDPLWRNAFAIFGYKIDAEQGRQSLIRALDLGTIPQEERTGEWLYLSHPQIPPEG